MKKERLDGDEAGKGFSGLELQAAGHRWMLDVAGCGAWRLRSYRERELDF